jgi:hypothetical protein
MNDLLNKRAGKKLRPIDVLDLLCMIGEMVVSGNVRRSALMILGDSFDKAFLKAKRWDLGNIPNWRANANLSVVCNDVDDLHPLFWKTYKQGEPFGIVNLSNFNKYGRMGELKKDHVQVVNPCGEIGLSPITKTKSGKVLKGGEACNLFEIFLPNIKDVREFVKVAKLGYRYCKRVALETYHRPEIDQIIKENMKLGVGITGVLQSPLFNEKDLNTVYKALVEEDIKYSKELGVGVSKRLTTVKPSGTLSLLADCTAGIHPAFSKYIIRRVRIATNDPLIPKLKEAGHYMEPVENFDGSFDYNTQVVDFYQEFGENTPVSNENWGMEAQLEVLKNAQKWWADNSVSVTVYYKEVQEVKDWLVDNLSEIKAISFLLQNEHGFKQAPLEAITREEYLERTKDIKDLDLDDLTEEGGIELKSSLECEGGACPIK